MNQKLQPLSLDLKKEYKALYSPSAKKVELVDVPDLQFLMIEGAIEPGMAPGTSPGFKEAMEAMYGAAYTLKFMSKLDPSNPVDYPVMALEGLWWVEDDNFIITRKDNWFYRLMILQPEIITPQRFSEALAQMRKKKGQQAGFDRLRLEHFREGLSLQIMHIGPYDTEPATLEKVQAYAAEEGYVLSGIHHEIYLGNPLRAQPEKLKTILRHPVTKAA